MRVSSTEFAQRREPVVEWKASPKPVQDFIQFAVTLMALRQKELCLFSCICGKPEICGDF